MTANAWNSLPRGLLRAGRGFTLVELVVVVALMGIFAAYAAAKLNVTESDASGYAEQVKSALRYVQKVAIAQRRSLSVNIVNGVGSESDCVANDTGTISSSVKEPGSGADICYRAKSGVTISPVLTISFDALGRPTPNSTSIVTVTDGVTPRYICVEAETGYVHEGQNATCT